MTQAVAGFNEHGIVLATDSRATRFAEDGRRESFNVKKLFSLDRCCAVLSGGAGVSAPLSLALRRQMGRPSGRLDLEEMVQFAIPFLSQGYARQLERHGPEAPGFRRLYFILAGLAAHRPPPGFALFLLGSEENALPLQVIPVNNVVVMPRNLGMEIKLAKALGQGAPLEEILHLSKDFLERQAAAREEVGPPFYFATITEAGYREVEL